MTSLRVTLGCIIGIFFMSTTVYSESIQNKIDYYNTLYKAVNEPDLIWIPKTAFNNEQFVHRKQLEEKVMTKLLYGGKYTLKHTLKSFLVRPYSQKQTKC